MYRLAPFCAVPPDCTLPVGRDAPAHPIQITIQGTIKTVGASSAQLLAALPPYRCGVPLAGRARPFSEGEDLLFRNAPGERSSPLRGQGVPFSFVFK